MKAFILSFGQAAAAIAIEGTVSGAVTTFIAMQYFKRQWGDGGLIIMERGNKQLYVILRNEGSVLLETIGVVRQERIPPSSE